MTDRANVSKEGPKSRNIEAENGDNVERRCLL